MLDWKYFRLIWCININHSDPNVLLLNCLPTYRDIKDVLITDLKLFHNKVVLVIKQPTKRKHPVDQIKNKLVVDKQTNATTSSCHVHQPD